MRLGVWLLLASVCDAAPEWTASEQAERVNPALVPSGTADSTATTRPLNLADQGHSINLGVRDAVHPTGEPAHLSWVSPPPPMPPAYPPQPKSPEYHSDYRTNFSDPNFVVPDPHTLCEPTTIKHSNRSASAPCLDTLSSFPAEGTECFYECLPGYVHTGRHVCQWHDFDWIRANQKHTDPDHNLRGWLATHGNQKRAFYGGRCLKMCGNLDEQTCHGTESIRRFPLSTLTTNITDAHAVHTDDDEDEDDEFAGLDSDTSGGKHGSHGAEDDGAEDHVSDCMETECFPSAKDNLWNMLKGVYDVMQIARDIQTGVYYNEVNLEWFVRYMERSHAKAYNVGTLTPGSPLEHCMGKDWFHEALHVYQKEMTHSGGEGLNRGGGGKNYSIDSTAMGIMTEVVGSAMGFQTPTEAAEKIMGTLGNLTEGSAHEVVHYANHSLKYEGPFKFYRDSRGYFQHFYVHRTMDRTSPMFTAMLVQASLFARSYFTAVAAGERSEPHATPPGLEVWDGVTYADLPNTPEGIATRDNFKKMTEELSAAVEELYDSVDFTQMLCDDKTGQLSPEGDGIPMTIGTPKSPNPDG